MKITHSKIDLDSILLNHNSPFYFQQLSVTIAYGRESQYNE